MPVGYHVAFLLSVVGASQLRSTVEHQSSSQLTSIYHYQDNTQLAAILNGRKNGNSQMKSCDVFLIFAQNIYPTK